MKQYTKLFSLQIDDNGFVFDPTKGISYTLNETALRVITLLKNGCPEENLHIRIAEEYAISLPSAEFDIENLLNTMKKYQLI
jgi:hypothetical protein